MASGNLLESDVVAKAFELADQLLLGVGGMATFEEVRAEIEGGGLAGEDDEDAADDRVGDGYSGTLRAASLFEAVGLGTEVGARPCSGAGSLDEGASDGGVARAGLALAPFPPALVVAGAEASPGSYLGRGAALGEVWPELGDDDLGDPLADPGDRVKASKVISERALTLGDLGADGVDALIEEVDHRQQLGEQEAMMGPQPSGQRPLEIWQLGAQLATRQLR